MNADIVGQCSRDDSVRGRVYPGGWPQHMASELATDFCNIDRRANLTREEFWEVCVRVCVSVSASMCVCVCVRKRVCVCEIDR